VPPTRKLYATFGLLLVGFLIRSLHPLDLPAVPAWLPRLGSLLEGAAMLALVVVLDVPRWRPHRAPPGESAASPSEHRAAGWLIVSAHLWLAIGGLMLVAEALAGWGLLPSPPLDAERHALGTGLVTLLIFGMAVRLLPGFAGRPLYSARLVWATLWLGNTAAVLRVAPLFLPPSPTSVGLLALSGLLALAAIGCLTWNLLRTLRRPAARPQARVASALVRGADSQNLPDSYPTGWGRRADTGRTL
jgi:hypothetical protein